jgi:hypothetical protein
MSVTSGSEVFAKELIYKEKKSIHPEYKFLRCLAQNGSQTATLSLTGTLVSLLKFPPRSLIWLKVN